MNSFRRISADWPLFLHFHMIVNRVGTDVWPLPNIHRNPYKSTQLIQCQVDEREKRPRDKKKRVRGTVMAGAYPMSRTHMAHPMRYTKRSGYSRGFVIIVMSGGHLLSSRTSFKQQHCKTNNIIHFSDHIILLLAQSTCVVRLRAYTREYYDDPYSL